MAQHKLADLPNPIYQNQSTNFQAAGSIQMLRTGRRRNPSNQGALSFSGRPSSFRDFAGRRWISRRSPLRASSSNSAQLVREMDMSIASVYMQAPALTPHQFMLNSSIDRSHQHNNFTGLHRALHPPQTAQLEMWNWRTTSGSTQDQSAASAMSSDGQAPPDLLVDSSAMGSDAVHNSTCDPTLADPSTVPVATPATPAALFGSDADTVVVVNPDTDTVAVVEDVATHIVFVIDRSGSMGISDVRPSRSAKFSVSRNHKNRLGCVYEAILRFVQTRMKARQADVVSVVLFDDDAIVAVEGKPISERVVDSLLDYGPCGGTSYSEGLLEARAVIQRVSRLEGAQDKHPVVVFLSDGGNNGFGTDPVEIVRQMREDDSRLLVNTIHFGSSYDDHDQQLLRDMAEAGDGTAGQGAGRPEPAAGHGGEVTPTQGTGPGGGGRWRWRPAWAEFRPAPARGSYQVSTTGVGDLSDRFERLANDMSSSDGSRW